MITALARDGLTRAIVERAVVPGMDRLTYHQVDCEEHTRGELQADLDVAMRATGTASILPWPDLLPMQAHVDYSPRNGGVVANLWQRVQQLAADNPAAWAEAPGSRCEVRAIDYPAQRQATRTGRMESPAEIAAYLDPTKYLRLPLGNDGGESTALGDPLHLTWFSYQNAQFAVELADNDLFTPFDLRHMERYLTVLDDGTAPDGLDLDPHAMLADRARVVLYLRPRTWRWYAHVWAHFEIVTGFESALNDEQFLDVWWDRPPFYPVRHNVVATAPMLDYWHEYEGALSLDAGIDSAWQLSRAFADMNHEIAQQEYAGLCMSQILLGVEPASISIQREPPLLGDIVLGIGRLDQATGIETRVWLRQRTDATALYPRTAVGLFYGEAPG